MATPLQYACLENPHGQRSLVGYSPWGHKESNRTEGLTRQTYTHTHTHTHTEICMLEDRTVSNVKSSPGRRPVWFHQRLQSHLWIHGRHHRVLTAEVILCMKPLWNLRSLKPQQTCVKCSPVFGQLMKAVHPTGNQL